MARGTVDLRDGRGKVREAAWRSRRAGKSS